MNFSSCLVVFRTKYCVEDEFTIHILNVLLSLETLEKSLSGLSQLKETVLATCLGTCYIVVLNMESTL